MRTCVLDETHFVERPRNEFIERPLTTVPYSGMKTLRVVAFILYLFLVICVILWMAKIHPFML